MPSETRTSEATPLDSHAARYALALDVGGTFTDVIIADQLGEQLWVTKSPSVPSNPATGFFQGVEKILGESGITPNAVARVLHGSTVVTNAIIEQKGARTGLLVTAGFRHLLEIGRAEIPRAANLFSWVKPPRPIPARYIFEVKERVRLDGSVVETLDESALDVVAQQIATCKLEALGIVFLHAYANPAHERRAAELLQAHLPDLEISTSSAVLPIFREYERATATALNASVQPVVGRYIGQLQNGLNQRRIKAPLFVMKSNGGTCPPAEAAKRGVHLALSGPAAGAAGAALLGKLSGLENMLTLDMGGTSTDVALIRDGRPVKTSSGKIGSHPLALSMVDIHTIGAGGGSIATVGELGAIRVGPESAGADPGPAAYGRGGRLATVTDANLLLGKIPQSLVDGSVKLDIMAAERAIEEGVARPLDIDRLQAAQGMLELVDNTMNGALKVMSVERGLDPRDFTLATFGGAGPLHGGRLMRMLGAPRLFVPRYPGILCAIGLLATDLRYDFVRTLLQRAGHFVPSEIEQVFADLHDSANERLAADNVAEENRLIVRHLDLRYERQGIELTVPLNNGIVNESLLQEAVEQFHQLHQQLYTFSAPETPVEIVNLRIDATGFTDHIQLAEIQSAAKSSKLKPCSERLACLDRGRLERVPVYRREKLLADQVLPGPAIVDQLDSTTVILSGQRASIDQYGNLLITESDI